MNLPNGITGFYSSTNNKSNEIDEKHFKNICFNLVGKSKEEY